MAVAINGTGSISGVPAGGMQDGAGPVLGTAQASTSGTSIDFTGIPSWVKQVTVMFNGVSTNGTSNFLIQLGTSGGFVSSGYVSGSWTSNTSQSSSTAGIIITATSTAAATRYGIALVCNVTGNTWLANYAGSWGAGSGDVAGGSIALSGTLDRVRITTVNGTDTFDAGSLNIMYE